MHNNSQPDYIQPSKSPSSKLKHSRDDSSLDKATKIKTMQSCPRITTEQSLKINPILNEINSKKKAHLKYSKSSPKLKSQNQSTFQCRPIKKFSCKNLKNLKLLSSTVDKLNQNSLTVLSAKSKVLQNLSVSKDTYSKDLLKQRSNLKKVANNKSNITSKLQKQAAEDKISTFVPFPINLSIQKKSKSPNNIRKIKKTQYNQPKQQKINLKIKLEGKTKTLKTLQNQIFELEKHRNSNKNKDEVSKNKKTTKQKIYHHLKMKTQQSMISCQSTPSQIFTHDIKFLELIGEGTFGKVYKGMIKKTSQIVAIKKVFQDKNYKNRQLQIVSLLGDSSFLMNVLGTYITYEGGNTNYPKQYLNIVMKYYEKDLFKEIKSKKSLSNLEIKIYSYQILRALLNLHSKSICHRDIKPHNILINKMSVAICDFGSAKILVPEQKNLPYICSRCYRAPELIFGSTQYTTMIDIWSVGCVILQMIHGSPFFIGNSSIDHLIEVIKVLGTPTKTQVKQMNPQYDLKDYKFPNIKNKSFSNLFPNTDPLLVSLLEQTMIYAPKQRLNAAQALVHEYFDELREEQRYTKLRNEYDLPDFFDFTPEQMKQNQHLYGQLVPNWYSKNHFTYFENEKIIKNNILKLYFD